MKETDWITFKNEIMQCRSYKETARHKIAYFEDELNLIMCFKTLDHELWCILSKEAIYELMKLRNFSPEESMDAFKMEHLKNSVRLIKNPMEMKA